MSASSSLIHTSGGVVGGISDDGAKWKNRYPFFRVFKDRYEAASIAKQRRDSAGILPTPLVKRASQAVNPGPTSAVPSPEGESIN